MRHAATDANHGHIIQGRRDVSLSETGRRQVAVLSESLTFVPSPDTLLCSPLQRAIETAKPLSERFAIPIQIDERLIEWSLGEAEGDTLEGYLHKNPDFKIRWDDMSFRYPGGESKQELANRAKYFVSDLRNSQCQSPLIIGHQAILNFVISFALNLPESAGMPFRLGNCGYAIVKPGLPYGRLVSFTGDPDLPWDPQ